ncbi:MAG: phosphomannomutase/phosphoglucomutase [Candidatus Thermoplasmatota archaeon]|nr:phosphomannomutase/phosphoglucomutase [Candidatus Thermoplasmatota archaeon]
MSIFKAYDIRGVYPREINEEVAERLGRAIARYFKTTVVVGRDTRLSSPALFKGLAKGITGEGYDVVDVGIIDAPGLYFATAYYDFKAGIMITASHNPKEYNGLKICRAGAIPVGSDSGLKDIEELFENIPVLSDSKRRGKIVEKDILNDYADHLMHFYKGAKHKAVVDCSNGATVRIVHKLQEKGIELKVINDEMNGNFPAHEPNPLKEENLQQLRDSMEDAELGICLDGDGDRVGIVYEGETIRNDFITAIIAKEMLRANPGATILYDLRSSRVVREEIERAGGRAVMCRVGHAFIKKQMREEDALFAGELSGHFYYRENYFADSGPITMLLLLGIENMDTQGLKRYFPSGEINVEVNDPQAALKRVEEKFAGRGKIFYLDGISFECEDYWFNVRPSNTEPLVRINVESNNKERTQAVVRLLLGTVKD